LRLQDNIVLGFVTNREVKERFGPLLVLTPGQAAHPFRDDGAPLFRDIVVH
jgi:hypothetical protein